jgi:hypothetical protein
MSVVSDSDGRVSGIGLALRRIAGPVMLLLGALGFAALMVSAGIENRWDLGFDFRGTLWEPARSLLNGAPVYPEPARASIVVGNPAVYPPLFVLLVVPLTAVSSSVAAWLWLVVLAAVVFLAMWLVGVRDWRCHVLALTSPVVLQGLIWGNLTLVLVLPLALAWRYRDRAFVAGFCVGLAIATKLFVLPLVAWLLFTRRYRATAIAAASALFLVALPWLAIGFDGLTDYPALLREVQDVYAVRSASLASVFGGFGLSVRAAVGLSGLAGLALVVFAYRLAKHPDGDRRAFALVVAACIVASPIAWPNYSALLLVPIAVTWPRLSIAWFFGYFSWLAELLPKPTALLPEPCCRPPDVPQQVWALSHATPAPWYALGMTIVVVTVAAWCVASKRDSLPPAASTRRLALHPTGKSADEVAWPS